MKRMRFALRLLWRDCRSGELTLLALALLIAVSGSSAVSLFADRLQRTMVLQAAEFLAGDLVIAASAPFDAIWLAQAKQFGLSHSQTTEFSSMLLENQQMLLASVKAVSERYPLRGQLQVADSNEGLETPSSHGPAPGEVWVERRVLSALNLHLGEPLTVGEKPLTISRILYYEPDKRGDFYSFSPRVMIHQADLEATGVIQPGSHAHYFHQFIGPEPALTAFKDWLKPRLNPSQRLMDLHDDRPELGGALQRAERYLGLASIVAILIAGVAIAMAAGRYSERHFDTTALLRCLGCRQLEIIGLYAFQFLALGLLTCSLGCLLGWLGQEALFSWLRPLLPERLAMPGIWAVLLGFATGMAILLGFALPPLLRLRKVSPLRVLRRDLQPLPASAWLTYLLAIALVSILIWRYSGDWQMTATIVAGGGLVLLGLIISLSLLLRLLHRSLPRLGLIWRFGLQGIVRNRQASLSQVLAFTITLAAMVLSVSVRNDLIDDWHRQLPAQAPNHFALNIPPDRVVEFQRNLEDLAINANAFYPIVRGRLITVNDEAVRRRVSKDSQGDAATQRELSLTWASTLPEDNTMSVGQPLPQTPGWVSVEKKLADNLSIRVGDRLNFTVGSTQFAATVANLRNLRWETMKPNFYMIFSPGTLDTFPTTYMTSFYLPDSQKQQLNALLKKHPVTTILEVDQILRQFRTVLEQLTEAINLVLYFALLAGLSVLFAAMYASLDQRIYEGTLMRTLGAKRGLLRKAHLIEFGSLGALSGFLAVALAHTVLFVLYQRLMQGNFNPDLRVWLYLPAIGALMVGMAGYWGTRNVLRQPPMQVLRRL